jgi:multidrug resistance efflux pump
VFEIILCSVFTILPDYLIRRYVQGKRFGKEINFFSVWYELRWGITGCLILAVGLITTVFYNHPSTTNATLYFRTVPILSEGVGRVAEVYVGISAPIAEGAPIFRLDSSKQEAAAETARRKIDEVEASMSEAQSDIIKAEGQLKQTQSAHQQTLDELKAKQELYKRDPGNVPFRTIETLLVREQGGLGAIVAAQAAKDAADIRVSKLLPAEKASAEAELAQAHVEINKTVVRAGVTGRVEQFTLRVGDIVNPLMRPAGVLIPDGAGQRGLQAGFGQIEAQIIKPGMAAEVTCISKPWTIIPMVVTNVQDYVASGQLRAGDNLVDARQVAVPGTLLVFLEPLYEGGLAGVTAGSSCIANAYSSNHDAIHADGTGSVRRVVLHAVDALGLLHALILRLQALVLPFKALVFGGH